MELKQAAKEQELSVRIKKEQEKAKKADETLQALKAERDELKVKKLEKLRAAHISRDHNIKTREQQLKKQEKAVNERLAKLAEERDERLRKAQEEAFLRDLEHQREMNDRNGESNQKAKVRVRQGNLSLSF